MPEVITAAQLADGIHPGDAGHARLAEVFGVGRGAAAARGRAGPGELTVAGLTVGRARW